MKRGLALFLVACSAVMLMTNAEAVMSQTCFTAGGANPGTPPVMTWSAIFILSPDETEVEYTINCCGCVPGNTWLIVSVASESFSTNLAGLAGKTCPFSGVWKSTDPVPLSAALVQALKDGLMELRLFKPICTPVSTPRYLVEEPCDE